MFGLGGAGKSQLVLNYIQEYRGDYRAVFWIDAGSKETIERDYIQIHGLLYGRSTSAGQEMVKVEDAVLAVKRWFQGREGRWLIVLDSADMIDDEQNKSYIDLGHFLPDTPGGTRNRHISELGSLGDNTVGGNRSRNDGIIRSDATVPVDGEYDRCRV